MKAVPHTIITALLGLWLVGAALAQQIPPPHTVSDVTPPAADVGMHPAYAKAVGRMAYIWGWPMVNMRNRRTAITQAAEPGRLDGVLPAAPSGRLGMLGDFIDPGQTLAACPDQDVVFGLGFFSLDEEPVVVQVPDFGDRFWVFGLFDARTDQFAEIGKPYGTQPGFYLVVGPNWSGETPAGIAALVRSSTALAAAVPRVFMDDTPEDRQAVQPLIDQIAAYPLKDFDGRMKIIDWRKTPAIPEPQSNGGGGSQWVVPEKFFDQFAEVLATVPPLPGEEALYGQFRALMEASARDPEIRAALVEVAFQAEREVMTPFIGWKRNGRPAGNGWNQATNTAGWGVDYFNRAGTAKSSMFHSKPNEVQSFYTDYDSSDGLLMGGNRYEITFAPGQEPPVNAFWSLTLYNERHFLNPNAHKRYALGSRDQKLKRNPDGSLTLYAGEKSPGGDKESNWLPAPDGHFSLYMRAYWGKPAILDGSWQPPRITKTAE